MSQIPSAFLESTTACAFELDLSGRITESSVSATALLERGHILLSREGVLTARREDEAALLHAAVMAAGAGDATQIVTLRSREGYPVMVLSFRLAVTVIRVTTIDLMTPAALDRAILTTIFRFTSAEARVAAALAGDATISQIASGSGVSLNTVRTHVRRIYLKMGVKSQARFMDVISRIQQLRTPAPLGEAKPDKSTGVTCSGDADPRAIE